LRSSNSVSVLVGDGDGTFQPAVDYSVGTGTNPRSVAWSDFNGDGFCDLAVANSSGGTNNAGNLAILLGNGDGTFQPAANYDTLGSEPVALTTGPFDSNQSQDVAVANFASSSVTIFLNDGNGGFTASGNYSVCVGPASISLIFIVSGFDLVVANFGSNDITLLVNTGNGTFNRSKNYAVGNMPVSVGVGNFNGGRLFDLAVVNKNDNTVSVLIAKLFKPLFRFPINFATCPSPQSLVALDLNHDNISDLVMACSDGVGVMVNTGP